MKNQTDKTSKNNHKLKSANKLKYHCFNNKKTLCVKYKIMTKIKIHKIIYSRII